MTNKMQAYMYKYTSDMLLCHIQHCQKYLEAIFVGSINIHGPL